MAQVDLRMYATAQATHPKAVLMTKTGQRVVLPFAPVGFTATGFARDWQQVSRPSRKPVMVDAGPGLRQVSYTITVGKADGSAITDVLAQLVAIAERPNAVVTAAGLSGLEAGPWRLVGCDVTVTRREHGTNAPVIAEVELGFAAVAEVKTRIARSGK